MPRGTHSQAFTANAPYVHPRSWRRFLLKLLPVSIPLSAESTRRDGDRSDTAFLDSSQDGISAGSVDPLWYPEDRTSLKRPRHVRKYTNDNTFNISATAANNEDNSGSIRVMRRWESEKKAEEKKPQLWTLWNSLNGYGKNDDDDDSDEYSEPLELTVGVRRRSNDCHAEYIGKFEGNYGRVEVQTRADGKSKLAARTRQLLGIEFDISGKVTRTPAKRHRWLFRGTQLSSAEVGVRCTDSGRNLVVGGTGNSWYVETSPFRNSSLEFYANPVERTYKLLFNDGSIGISDGYYRPFVSIRQVTVKHNKIEYESNSGKWDTSVSKDEVTMRIRCADGRGRLNFELGRENRSAMECSIETHDAEFHTLQSRLLARIDSERGVSVRFGRFY